MKAVHRAGALALLFVVTTTAVAQPALAQVPPAGGSSPAAAEAGSRVTSSQTPPDAIILKNGGILRGVFVDVVPGSHARIQLATGEVAKVGWGDIQRIDRANGPSMTADTPAPAPTSTSTSGHDGGHVLVVIRSPRPVTLEGRGPGEGSWRVMCTSPCNESLPRDHTYRIVGSNVRTSSQFRLTGRPGETTYIAVDPASKAAFVLGIVGTSIGGVTAMVGALLALVGAVAEGVESSDDSYSYSREDAEDLKNAGLITMGVGVLLTAASVVALASNVHSDVQQGARDPGLSDAAAAVRRPEWRSPSTAELSPPRATSFPLLSVSF